MIPKQQFDESAKIIQKFKDETGLNVIIGQGYVACFGNNTVFINKNLLKHPNLLKPILAHEKEHFEDEQHEKTLLESIKNVIKTDSRDILNKSKHLNLLGFNFRYPLSMIPIFFYYNDKGKLEYVIVMNQLILMITLTLLMLFILSTIIK